MQRAPAGALLDHGLFDCVAGDLDIERGQVGWSAHRQGAVARVLGQAHGAGPTHGRRPDQTAATLRLHIPEDLAIVGMDGIREALHGSVRLTTVALPLAELAACAFEALDDWALRSEVTQRMLSGTLIVGDTCGTH